MLSVEQPDDDMLRLRKLRIKKKSVFYKKNIFYKKNMTNRIFYKKSESN